MIRRIGWVWTLTFLTVFLAVTAFGLHHIKFCPSTEWGTVKVWRATASVPTGGDVSKHVELVEIPARYASNYLLHETDRLDITNSTTRPLAWGDYLTTEDLETPINEPERIFRDVLFPRSDQFSGDIVSVKDLEIVRVAVPPDFDASRYAVAPKSEDRKLRLTRDVAPSHVLMKTDVEFLSGDEGPVDP